MLKKFVYIFVAILCLFLFLYALEEVTDGGVENWIDANDLTNWTETVSGSTVLSQEDTIKHGGSYSVKVALDGSEGKFSQIITLEMNESYNLTFWHKAPIGEYVRCNLFGGTAYLKDDETWDTSGYIRATGTGDWAEKEINFTGHASQTAFTLEFVDFGTQDYTYYIDDISIVGGQGPQEVLAGSCSRTDIQTAIDAANDGDTVVIPSGDCTFDSPYQVYVLGKILSFRGAGSSSTILRNTSTIDFAGMFVMWRSDPGPSPSVDDFEISGIKFIGEGSQSYADEGIVMCRGPRNFQIHDCVFEDFGYAGIYLNGMTTEAGAPVRIPTGVIYNCTFTDCYKAGYGYGVQVEGDNQWEDPLTLGTSLAVFVEDCVFSGFRHTIASQKNSKYVFRYNTVTDAYTGTDSYIDAHGNPGTHRGSRSYEIYENTLSHSTGHSGYAIGIRGGDGVIFNNTMTNFDVTVIYFSNELCANNGGSGYPKDDQTRAAYIWGNTNDAAPVDGTPSTCTENSGQIIVEDRDIFNEQLGGYTPYTYPHPSRSDGARLLIKNVLRIRNVLRIK